MKPLITVGIPIFNVENYVKDCLVSVFNQTYENIEMIIVDDKGSDNSMTIVNQIISESSKKNRVTIIRQPHNMGVGIARNIIINKAKGDYLFFIDSDDVISPDCIDFLYKKVSKYNLDFACCSMEETDDKLNTIEKQTFENKYCLNNQSALKFAFIDNQTMPLCNCWNKLYKTNFLRKNNILFTPNIYYEDSFFFLKLISNAASCAFFSENTYKYRQNINSITSISSGTFNEKEIRDMTYTLKLEKEYIKKLKENEIYSDIVLSYAKKSYFCFKSYYKNNKNNLNIKPYINDLIYFPLGFFEILSMKRNICKNLFFLLIDRIPYSFKCIIINI